MTEREPENAGKVSELITMTEAIRRVRCDYYVFSFLLKFLKVPRFQAGKRLMIHPDSVTMVDNWLWEQDPEGEFRMERSCYGRKKAVAPSPQDNVLASAR